MKKSPDNDFQLYLKQLGGNLKNERIKNGITQEMFAEMNNIDYKYYQRIETGKVNITIKTLYKLSKSLKINPNSLLDHKKK